jgi:phosphosulfolactate synthase
MLNLPAREVKDRKFGITSINDTRTTIAELSHILLDYSNYIDIAKIGIGVAHILPRLKEKVKLYKEHNVDVYFGGTLFEKYYHQDKLIEYLRFLDKFDIGTIEISTGTIDIPLEDRLKLVQRLKANFRVICEVGSKDPDNIMPPSQWNEEIKELLNEGALFIITEGRDSGTSGIYRPSGELRSGLISDIIKNTDVNKIIFEAPSNKLQMHFINLVGANVNLGNINPNDVIVLETQRLGLRSETFFNT